MKDRTIKRLQDQIKALQAPVKGNVFSAVCDLLSWVQMQDTVNSLLCLIFPTVNQKAAPTIPKEYLGMLEYKKEDEDRIVRKLILGKFSWQYAIPTTYTQHTIKKSGISQIVCC